MHLLGNDSTLVGPDASIVVECDKEDDGIIYVLNRGNLKKFEVDKVFGPRSSQQEVIIVVPCILLYS